MPIVRPHKFSLVLLAGIVAASLCSASFAQAPSSDRGIRNSANERAREKRKALDDAAMEKQKRREEQDQRTLELVEARDRKRADCRQQAKEQGLHWMKRVRFIRQCMAQ
jgi:hypothetical protein